MNNSAWLLNRGSYRSAHVLLNILNRLTKRDKMQGLPSILSLFHNNFNKFHNTGAGMLDSNYHKTLKLLKNHILGFETKIFQSFTEHYNGHHYITLLNLLITSGLSILMHGVISLTDRTSCDRRFFAYAISTKSLCHRYKQKF